MTENKIFEKIAAEMVPDDAVGASAYRAIAVEAMQRFSAHVTTPDEYATAIEENVREAARTVAAKLRRVADDVERAAALDDVDKIPKEVADLVVCGVANANIDAPARWLNEVHILRRARAEGKI